MRLTDYADAFVGVRLLIQVSVFCKPVSPKIQGCQITLVLSSSDNLEEVDLRVKTKTRKGRHRNQVSSKP